MALHSAIKGKLISVIGDEVSSIRNQDEEEKTKNNFVLKMILRF